MRYLRANNFIHPQFFLSLLMSYRAAAYLLYVLSVGSEAFFVVLPGLVYE